LGLQTAFIRRQGKVLFPLAAQPDYKVLDVNELASILAKFN
jgi:2-haloacid dehalogenase